MLFPTTDFAVFFAVVFLGHWLLNSFPTRWKVFMIVASYLFYAWWDWRLVWRPRAPSPRGERSWSTGPTASGRDCD
jgi:hypothetical protein